MMMGGEFVDNSRRSDLVLNGEGFVERDCHLQWQSQCPVPHVVEAGDSFAVRRSNDGSYDMVNKSQNQQMRTLSQFNDQGLSIRDRDTASTKFQWKHLLIESRNSMGHGVQNDFKGSGCAPKYARDVGVMEKCVPFESERTRNVPNFLSRDDVAECHGCTRNVVGQLEDGEDLRHRQYQPRLDRVMSRKSYEEGNRLRFRSEDSSRSLTPLSQSSSQQTPLRGIPVDHMQGSHHEVIHCSAGGSGNRYIIQPSRYDSYHQIPDSRAATDVHPYSNEEISYLGDDYSPNVGRARDYIHPETQRSGRVYLSASCQDIYDNIQEYNEQGDTHGNNVLDPMLQGLDNVGNPYKSVLREDGPQSFHHRLQGESVLDNHDVTRPAYEIEHNYVVLGSKSPYLEYEGEAIVSHESQPLEEECGFLTDANSMHYEERHWPVSRSDGGSHMDENLSKSKRRASTLVGRGMSYNGEQLSAKPEKGSDHSTRSFSHHRELQIRENIGVFKPGAGLQFSGLSEAIQSRLSKPQQSGSSDIKKRLKTPKTFPPSCAPQSHKYRKKNARGWMRHSPQVIHTVSASQHYGNTGHSSKKKRLNPASRMLTSDGPQDPQVSHPWVDIESQEFSGKKSGRKEICHFQEADPDNSELKVEPADKDLPENSQEFKRQVDEWFLKCILYLNADPDLQKIFKDQGKAGNLKCIICSSSKEFDIKGVTTHAFTSPKIGLRARHLGFHIALCVLMGWDSAVASNGRWVCRSLPDAQAWDVKEDIIVWPPVVIIHNSLAEKNLNEQVKVSIEQLENILRDIGFDKGKTKVCHGKAGKPNIVVAKFNPTLSGLQEAERLHNYFVERKRGRTELQKISACSSSSEDTQVPVDKVEDALYGYLGIIEDLGKLHLDMKRNRHCCARSKKETFAHADVPAQG